jgi:putative photosynthetic complex assembly protein 2
VVGYLAAILFALFVWWFSTGALIYLNFRPQHTFKWSLTGATGILLAAIYTLFVTAADTSLAGTYMAFTATLLIWAWLEITFYMGLVTGPRKTSCAPGCKGVRHFGHALLASLWHELAIVTCGLLVWAASHKAPNDIALWTFVTLWWMHESARLNVFLGVPNLSEHILPPHLAYLKSFFRHRPMNLLFPVSITVSTAALAMIIDAIAKAPADSPALHGLLLVGTLLGLAILEHWFLVLPFDASQLWNWSLDKTRGGPAAARNPIAHEGGFALETPATRAVERARASIRINGHAGGLSTISVANRRPL